MKNKIIFTIFLVLLIIIFLKLISFGATFTDVLQDPTRYQPTEIGSPVAEGVISKILSAVSTIGIAVSVVMLAVIGIKYMMGSVEEKAEYKKSLIPYVIGAGMLFGITTLTKILVAIGEEISNI